MQLYDRAIKLWNNLSVADIASIIAALIALITLALTAYAVCVAIKSFKCTTTLQLELFFLNSYNDCIDSTFDKDAEKDKKYIGYKRTKFLVAIDLYCKYALNGHLDKKLSDDNLNLYKEIILLFKDDIKQDIEDYNNIADYVKKYKISLE